MKKISMTNHGYLKKMHDLNRLEASIVRDRYRLRKIQCRSSWERRQIHKLAEKYNIQHVTLVDYTQFHVGISLHIDRSDDYQVFYGYKLTPTPYSYVLLNYPIFRKIEIGSPSILPDPEEDGLYRRSEIKDAIRRYSSNKDRYQDIRDIGYRNLQEIVRKYTIYPENKKRIIQNIGTKMLETTSFNDIDIVH